MKSLQSLDDIERLYAARGGLNYGEGVTQIEHALQCAGLAEASGAAPSLVIAALLHDIGHLFENEQDVTNASLDAHHEAAGARLLEAFFPETVWRPVALHVAAKRYLCFMEPQYVNGLSSASQKSLKLQGGAFDQSQALAFERSTHWREAVQLRRFDDMGKRDEITNRAFAHYVPLMHNLRAGVL